MFEFVNRFWCKEKEDSAREIERKKYRIYKKIFREGDSIYVFEEHQGEVAPISGYSLPELAEQIKSEIEGEPFRDFLINFTPLYALEIKVNSAPYYCWLLNDAEIGEMVKLLLKIKR